MSPRLKDKEHVMKVRLLQSMFIRGEPKGPGDEVTLPDNDAKYLIARGKAENIKPKARKETASSKDAEKREKATK